MILFPDRGKGWHEDDPGIVDVELVGRHVSNLVGGITIATENVDYTKLLDRVPDQRSTNSCVGQAFATALYLTAKLAGMPIPRPSAKAIYDFARAEDEPYEALQDVGSRPLAAIRCLTEKGLVAEEGVYGWPILFDSFGRAANINQPPPLDVYQNALDAKLGNYYRISAGTGASTLVRHALSRGYCPVFAMPVDEAFERWSSEMVYEGRTGTILGWHMQAIAGFVDGALLVPGSWGPYWANGGVVKIANDYFDSGECKDILVPVAVPNLAVM